LRRALGLSKRARERGGVSSSFGREEPHRHPATRGPVAKASGGSVRGGRLHEPSLHSLDKTRAAAFAASRAPAWCRRATLAHAIGGRVSRWKRHPAPSQGGAARSTTRQPGRFCQLSSFPPKIKTCIYRGSPSFGDPGGRLRSKLLDYPTVRI
jgi:hypothetical protein